MTDTEKHVSENLLSPDQVRRRLGLKSKTNHTVMRWAKRGLLTPIYLGPRTVRFRPEEIESFIERGVA